LIEVHGVFLRGQKSEVRLLSGQDSDRLTGGSDVGLGS
jgi:hypothetical protein